LKNFVNSPEGSQLHFLISHETTGYKLANNICDLTSVQIYFHYLVAKKQSEMIDAVMKNNGKTTTNNPLKILGNESPEEIKEKLDIMKESMRGY
jgi:hypothetical protein